MGEALVILGKGLSRRCLPMHLADGVRAVWTLNDDYLAGVTTLHFDIHTPYREAFVAPCAGGAPVMVMDRSACDAHDHAQLYPLDTVREHFGLTPGREYLATTPAYMLALALMTGKWDRIVLCGIDFPWQCRPEAIWERPCMEFYLGWGAARGVNIVVPEESSLLTTAEDGCRLPYGRHKLKRVSDPIVWAVTGVQHEPATRKKAVG